MALYLDRAQLARP